MKYIKKFENKNLGSFIKTVKDAKELATKAHHGVKRRGGEPYIIHPESVAKIVHDVKSSKEIASLIAAAYLHDTVEDTDITLDEIREKFGELVMSLVSELTNNDEKLKMLGKEEYLIDKMLNMSSWALVIKLADRLHNLKDFEKIMLGDNDKAKKWVNNYAKQTKSIIDNLKWYRKLSSTQKVLVNRIKKGIKPYI